jgi:hypothetical protein
MLLSRIIGAGVAALAVGGIAPHGLSADPSASLSSGLSSAEMALLYGGIGLMGLAALSRARA